MTFRLSPANHRHLQLIIGLVEEAALWLRGKGTDQWERPWPSRAKRDARILRDLWARRTWIAWENGVPAATITADETANPMLWTGWERAEAATYVHRLVVARKYAGRGLGADLLDWAGNRAAKHYGAQWIRIDVWTTNTPLHRYYEAQGFKFVRYCSDPEYPSGALFQKATDQIAESDNHVLEEVPERILVPNGRQRIHMPNARSHEQQNGCRYTVRAELFNRSS
ncbi:MAG: GNAT family N-acetyltransferase [Micromonosporaceae bacterium]